MKRITAVMATFCIGILFTYTVIGLTSQNPQPQSISAHSETFAKQLGGNVYAVAKQGNTAYIGIGNSLAVLDVQDPANPQLIGQTDQLSNAVYALTLYGNYGLAPEPYGLRVFDLSDPTNPQLVGTYSLPSQYVSKVVVSGSTAFVTEDRIFDDATKGGLRILNISDPLNINQIAIFGQGNGVKDIAIRNNYAYLAYRQYSGPGSYSRQLMIVDISTLSSPTEAYALSTSIDDVAIYSSTLYVLSGNDVDIYDISTPDAPAYQSDIDNTKNDEIVVFGSRLFVIDDYTGIEVFDLTNPTNPSEIDSYQANNLTVPIGNVVADGNTAYIAYYPAGLHIVNVGGSITELGRYDQFAHPIDALNVGNYTYLLNQYNDLYVLDTINPLQPVTMANYTHTTHFSAMTLNNQNLFLMGPYQFDILDVTAPLNPTYLSHHYTIERIQEMFIDGDFAYLGMRDDSTNSLEVVRIADTTTPTKTASIGTVGRIYGGGAIVGNYFFMNELNWGSGDPAFQVIDISDPFNPQIEKTLTFTGNLESLAIIGNYAYLANHEVGIQIVNITDPLNPVKEGVYTIPNSSTYDYWVKAVDGQLYASSELNDDTYAQHILDVTNPTAPVKVGEFNHFNPGLQRLTEGTEVNGYLYYPTERDGLLVYECHDCATSRSKIFLPFVIKN